MEEGPLCPVCESPVEFGRNRTTSMSGPSIEYFYDENGLQHMHDKINNSFTDWKCTGNPLHAGVAEHNPFCRIRGCTYNDTISMTLRTHEECEAEKKRKRMEFDTMLATRQNEKKYKQKVIQDLTQTSGRWYPAFVDVIISYIKQFLSFY